MTHTISRRTVAKGAAWAAPAVIASTVVPAYAASGECLSANLATAVETAFDTYYQEVLDNNPELKGLDGTSIRLWFRNTSGINGGLHTSQIAIQTSPAGTWPAALRTLQAVDGSVAAAQAKFEAKTPPLRFEMLVRNVDTSPAINYVLGGKQSVGAGTYGDINIMPIKHHPNGNWDVRNGSNTQTTGLYGANPAFSTPVFVDNPLASNRRDVSGNHYTDYRALWYQAAPAGADEAYTTAGANNGNVSSATRLGNGYSIDENVAGVTAKQNSLAYQLIPYNVNAVFSGNPTVLAYSNWGDGGAPGGRIYTATGIRLLDLVAAPTKEYITTLVRNDKTVSACDPAVIEAAYQTQLASWYASDKRYAGIDVSYTGWGVLEKDENGLPTGQSGNIATLPVTGADTTIWSHEIGAFEGSENHGNLGGRTSGPALDFFDSQLVGTRNGGDSTLGIQMNYADGIW